jgi:hypothetical protein
MGHRRKRIPSVSDANKNRVAVWINQGKFGKTCILSSEKKCGERISFLQHMPQIEENAKTDQGGKNPE